MSCCMQELAQRALVAYVRSVFLQPNKAVFDASALPAAEYALSLGLTSVPKLRFLKRHGPQKGAAANGAQKHASQDAGKEVGVEQAAGQQAGSLSAAALAESESDSEGISEAETSSDQSPGQKGLRGLHAAGRGSKRSRTGADEEEDDIGGKGLVPRFPHHSADVHSRRQSPPALLLGCLDHDGHCGTS